MNLVEVVIVKDKDQEISCFEKNWEKLEQFVKSSTLATLRINIEPNLLQEIQKWTKTNTDKILKWLLSDNERDVVHYKPFIWNNKKINSTIDNNIRFNRT